MQEWAGYVPQAEWLSVGDLVARDCEPSYDTPERRGLIGHRLVVGLQHSGLVELVPRSALTRKVASSILAPRTESNGNAKGD